MYKKPILVIITLAGLAVFINTVTHSPQSDNADDRQIVSRTTPPVRSVAVKEMTETKAGTTTPAAPIPAEDWLIEPGHRVGSITSRTTLAELQKLFGKQNVRAGKVPGPEGTEWDGAFLFPDQPDKKLKLIWKEASKPQTVGIAIIESPKSVWHTSEGISVGTTLRELEAMNHGPFTLSGFDWDYGGTVLSWGDHGKLRPKFQQNGGLVVRLYPALEGDPKALQKVAGDETFSSSNPAMQLLNPTVSELQVILQ